MTRPHDLRRGGVVLAAEEPDLLGPLQPDGPGQQAGAVAAVEAADLGPGLAEPGVVGGDGQVADQVEDVPAADGVAGHHGHHRLGQPPDLDLEVEHVEPADALPGHVVVAEVAVVAPDLLVAARAEGVGALAGEDDDPDRRVVPGHVEGVAQLEQGLGTEGVADLGTADGQLGDAVGHVHADVPVVAPGLPGRQRAAPGTGRPGRSAGRYDRLHLTLPRACPVHRPARLQPFDHSLLESLLVRSPRLPAWVSW